MTPTTASHRTRALAPVAAVGLVVGLAGCSAAADPGIAAVVAGQEVRVDDVSAVVLELPPEISGSVEVPPSEVVRVLVSQEAVSELARQQGVLLTRDEGRAQLQALDEEGGREPREYSDATADVIANLLMRQQLSQSGEEGLAQLQEALVAVETSDDAVLNPRYGTVTEDGIRFGTYDHEWFATLTDPAGNALNPDGTPVAPAPAEQPLPEG